MFPAKLSTALRIFFYSVGFPCMLYSFFNYEYLGITANVLIGVYFAGRITRGLNHLKQAL